MGTRRRDKQQGLPIDISTTALNLSYFSLMSQYNTIRDATWGRVPWSCDHVTMDLALTGSTASLAVQWASNLSKKTNRIFKNRFQTFCCIFL